MAHCSSDTCLPGSPAVTFGLLPEDWIAANLADTLGVEQALRAGYAITAAFWSITLILSPLILAFSIKEETT